MGFDEPARRGEARGDERERLRQEHERLRRPTSACGREAEHERDHEILEDEDREHEVRLVVAEAPEVDQPFHRDRARGDVHAGGEHERRVREPERGDADEEAEAEVEGEVDEASETHVAAGPADARQAELEPEEEEEEDDAELRQEVGHL